MTRTFPTTTPGIAATRSRRAFRDRYNIADVVRSGDVDDRVEYVWTVPDDMRPYDAETRCSSAA